MKKGLIGCLVVGLLLIVVGGGLAYWFVLRPMWASASASVDSVKELAKIGQASEQIKNTSEFTPPADGTLTAAQVAMYLGVQEAVQAQIEGKVDAIKVKGEAIEAKAKAEGHDVGVSDGMALMSEMTALIAKAKQAQVEALNRNNTSESEYAWVREQIYGALPFAGTDAIPEQLKGQVNEANVNLVRPHKDVLTKAMGNTMIGM
jgi:hypothetical protein